MKQVFCYRSCKSNNAMTIGLLAQTFCYYSQKMNGAITFGQSCIKIGTMCVRSLLSANSISSMHWPAGIDGNTVNRSDVCSSDALNLDLSCCLCSVLHSLCRHPPKCGPVPVGIRTPRRIVDQRTHCKLLVHKGLNCQHMGMLPW